MAERPQYEDPEIEALATVRDALEPFNITVRGRILRYAMDRLHHESLEADALATTEQRDG
jgi:hypothetical protein